jgi:hypothetical protein
VPSVALLPMDESDFLWWCGVRVRVRCPEIIEEYHSETLSVPVPDVFRILSPDFTIGAQRSQPGIRSHNPF